ncbi:response regulator transcription factor [Ruminiclostridium cellobioparum]|uniref:Stage 0 sporulation protein A homolog n=1 Tax=Ruminiclostridium cellobioparum subsp. termitidis CT1112 TaxID=1195236 RepID=S0FMM8_RUMCE|nr:response regulator transcription factor [Ruminiclostridium cellobioparum]EMS73480.1 two-component response regulatory protein [Ruminiclostridium cellobioparum subsp. termitidis CT1112]
MVPTTILIVEDEKQIARFLELELKHEGYAVEIEYDGRGGLRKAEENEPDLILLDIMLPGINGMEVCRRIRQFSEVPVIMLTAKDETTDKVMGLDIGANDYVTKPFVIEELLARIRAVLRNRNQSKQPQKSLAAGDLRMDLAKRQVFRGDESIDLTKKEYDLLEYLLRNKGIVLTRDQILENVWGYDYAGDTNVVDVYIRYLRSKIDDEHDTKLIQTVRGVGYILREEKG